MKRSGLLRRSPLRPGAGLLRSAPLPKVSAKRKVENRQRAKAVRALREAGDWCARCGRPGVVTDGHEKLARAHGGDITRPDMLLCRAECNTWAEDNPTLAAWQGWKVSAKWPTAPCIADGRCPAGAHPLGTCCVEVAA